LLDAAGNATHGSWQMVRVFFTFTIKRQDFSQNASQSRGEATLFLGIFTTYKRLTIYPLPEDFAKEDSHRRVRNHHLSVANLTLPPNVGLKCCKSSAEDLACSLM